LQGDLQAQCQWRVGCFVATVTKSVAAISTRCGGGTDMTRHTTITEPDERGAGGWLSLQEFCDELGVSPHTAYKWSAAGQASGRFPRFCRLPNGRIRIRREWFDAWIESLGAAR
jgi:predicted DNA-binding transcriptional regulator AlpA